MSNAVAFPPLRTAKSNTFTPPPFKDFPTLPEIFAFHALNSSRHPIFVHAGDSTGTVHQIYFPEAYAAIQRGHGIVSRHHSAITESPIVGILTNLDTMTYMALLVGIMHAGLTPFAISTRNSVDGVVHLIRSTGLQLLFVSQDRTMQRLASEVGARLKDEGIIINIIPAPQFSDLYNEDSTYRELLPMKNSSDPVTIILHSSGSTAQPKPISIRNRNFLQWGCHPYYGDIDVVGVRMSAHSLPIYREYCYKFAVFKPANPPTIPTPDVFLHEVAATKCQIVFCVPIFVEAWARSPENFPILRDLHALIYAGASLARETGDRLVNAGVNLTPFYGLTETGCNTPFLCKSQKPDPSHWRFFKLTPRCRIHLQPHGTVEEGEIAELIILDSESYSPCVLNTTVNSQPAFATGDLVLRHPTERDKFCVYGRVDDQLVLSTGEKVTFIITITETLFSQDPSIASAVIFGYARFQCGVLVQPAEAFDPTDEQILAAFRNLIWPTVEKVNDIAPEHARIFKEMIITTYPKKPLELTAKGTPRRQMCLKAYKEEIDALYDAVKESSQTDIPIPGSWTKENATQFIESAVKRVMKHPVAVDEDIFLQGCDSLQATWIRNSILHAIRSSKNNANIHKVPLNIVYAHPSILALGNRFWQVISGTEVSGDRDQATRMKTRCTEMESLVAKYTTAIPMPTWRILSEPCREETVLLTGSTGRLGCYILKQLTDREDILKVYALNRSVLGLSSQERQREALKIWDLNINPEAFQKIVFLEYSPSENKLGLPEDAYLELQATVTTIIHNGWRVDFNIGLRSYENLIAGTRRLLDLAVGSSVYNGPKFIFASSISVFGNLGDGEPAPESSVPASMAAGFGYGEGKWVTENICQKISEATGLSLSIIRIGQMSGDAGGHWNVKEWVPALVKIGKAIGSLPSRDESVTWLPVDTAAAAILDILKKTPPTFLNLVHPRPRAWNDIFKATADYLQLGFISYEEWAKQLYARKDTIVHEIQDASVDLVDFFLRGQFGDGRYTMDVTLETCPSLKNLEPLEMTHVIKSLPFWNI
ncbi:hypothetical protein AGABI2DRAFT_211390 [Agaricus bisporus var. bisporus H97]|uniref:hypothetical protein n=1 Tax=Agaricus bisporus var. bisporus (strain H97 / ATCC MYA-4626 / FGSC 10389) TaxID=936046 RepID=UPI00029F78FD|nr:hypothetical protein AGABI2DRAFT_211390 [Agaricus bisporus var. bisporus H97]EKV42759.1 hypothetical protein AGABI2DRAFT_211390 [Agaricus bisporus var. bisporus H97]